jgi:HEAT repeat protein
MAAVWALDGVDEPDTEALLWRALGDRDETVRASAASSLIRRDPRRPAGPLLAALRQSEPGTVVASAAGTPTAEEIVRFDLAQLKSVDVVPTLVEALASGAAELRHRVVRRLGQTRDPRALAPLTAALTDADQQVRDAAPFALIWFGEAAAAALIDASQNGDEQMRSHAIGSLGYVDGGEAAANRVLDGVLHDPSRRVRRDARDAVLQLQEVLEPRLTQISRSGTRQERSRARQLLRFLRRRARQRQRMTKAMQGAPWRKSLFLLTSVPCAVFVLTLEHFRMRARDRRRTGRR